MKQPKLRFYLESSPNKEGERRIFMDVNIGYAEVDPSREIKNFKSDQKTYKPIKISAMCRIKPEHFGVYKMKGNRRVLVFDEKIFNRYAKNHRSLRTKISKMKRAVEDVTNDFYLQDLTPTHREFKDALEIKLGRKKKEVIREKTVLEFLYQKIEHDREAIRMRKKDAPSENYIKTYVSLSRMFENYELATDSKVRFSDFNSTTFYWDFFKVVDAIYRGEIEVDNPNQKKKQRKDPTGYNAKSINKYLKLLHRILSQGKKGGANVTLDLSDSSLFLENPPAEKEIYFTEGDLSNALVNRIGDHELETVRHYLIMASLMGLRVEDMEGLHKLSPELYRGKKMSFYGVRTNIGKAKTEVIIPLLKPVRDILVVNDNKFPEFREHEINTGLKVLCKLLSIDSPERRSKVSFSQGKLVTNNIPKYELVSTHDCRRSFITNLLENNVDGDKIKYITHPKRQETKDMIALYNKANLIDKAELFLFELKIKSRSETYKY